MVRVNVHEAKTQLSQLLARVEAGEEVVIARAGEPVARLIPVHRRGLRKLGRLAGQFEIPTDFDESNPEIERMFEGE